MTTSKPDNTICGHLNSKEIYKFETARLYLCNNCGIVFSDRYRQGLDPASLYENYYKNEMSSRFNFGIEHIVRLFRFFRAFKIFTVCPRAKKVLDIGSGRGFTLFYLKKYYGYIRTAGTQISKNAFHFSRDKLGLEIYNQDLLETPLKKASFDVITIWHVLEHVNEPELYGYDVQVQETRVLFTFYWKLLRHEPRDVNLFIDLIDQKGHFVHRRIRPICYRIWPTQAWEVGPLIQEHQYVSLSPDEKARLGSFKIGFFEHTTRKTISTSSPDYLGRFTLAVGN